LLAQQELVEITSIPGDDAAGIVELDGVTAVKWYNERPSDFQVTLFIIVPTSVDGLLPSGLR